MSAINQANYDSDSNIAYRRKISSAGQEKESDNKSMSSTSKSAEEADDESEFILPRSLGLWGAVSFNIGTMIGSGIFVSPKGVLSSTGSVGASMVVWSLCGVISLLGGLCYAELGTIVRKSGGDFSFLLAAFGGPLAFMDMFAMTFISKSSSQAIMSMTCGEYVLGIFFDDSCGDPPELIVKSIAILVIMTITIANVIGAQQGNRIQIFFTAAKLGALGIIIIGGIIQLAEGHTENFENSFEGSETNVGQIALGFYSGMWAYTGWQTVTYITEEVTQPKRNIPLSIILSVVIVTCVYIMTNISYFTVMTPEELLDSPAVALTWAEKVMPGGAWLISLAVAFSTFGSTNGSVFSGSRTTYRVSREGHFPSILGMLHVTKMTPVPAIVFNSIFAVIYIIPSEIDDLIDLFNFVTWTVTALVMVALMVLRYKYKHIARPFKVPLVIPIIMFFVSAYLVIAPLIDDPKLGYIFALVLLLGSLGFYFPLVYFDKQPPCMHTVTAKLQLFLSVCPSEIDDETLTEFNKKELGEKAIDEQPSDELNEKELDETSVIDQTLTQI